MSDRLFEGIGAPISIAYNDGEPSIDPTLDSCCQREIESNRKRSTIETTLRAHDRVAQAETLRKQFDYSYNSFNLVNGLSFGSGCRCCYDPNGDGGEYELLAAARKERGDDELLENEVKGGKNVEGATDRDNEINHGNSSSDDSDDEFDYLLDEEFETTAEHDLQAHRRAELENMARHHEVLRYHGFGVHRQMHPQRLFSCIGYQNVDRDGYVPAGAVVHLYDAFSPLSVSLDLCLEDMASRYPGTKFVRGMGASSLVFAKDSDDSHKWKKGNLPMLLALKDGKVVAFSSGLRDFCNSTNNATVEPRMVEQWLDHTGALIDAAPPIEAVCRIRPEEDMLLANMRQLSGLGKNSDGFDIGEKDRYDCGVDGCNKTFFHEHVGVKNEAQEGVLVSESQVTSSAAEPSSS